MICSKDLKSARSGSKVPCWNKLFIIVFMVTIGIINFGCQCECEEANDVYYVKYEVYSTSIYSQLTLHTKVNGEDNTDVNFTFYDDTQWETIIGPVQKGFNATLEVSVETAILIHTKIYVSKNDSPFAIKASDSSDTYRTSGQLSYTIDY